ncbi:hypothetical protein OF83DRAFT_1144324 [Amylostereum chailletii]|nr:hypothetical protein OF83DRAFT_1144324 [Amylostereum chailletii]
MELATALAALHLPSVTPVASLPVELLADVFTHVGDLRDIFSCSHTCKFHMEPPVDQALPRAV